MKVCPIIINHDRASCFKFLSLFGGRWSKCKFAELSCTYIGTVIWIFSLMRLLEQQRTQQRSLHRNDNRFCDRSTNGAAGSWARSSRLSVHQFDRRILHRRKHHGDRRDHRQFLLVDVRQLGSHFGVCQERHSQWCFSHCDRWLGLSGWHRKDHNSGWRHHRIRREDRWKLEHRSQVKFGSEIKKFVFTPRLLQLLGHLYTWPSGLYAGYQVQERPEQKFSRWRYCSDRHLTVWYHFNRKFQPIVALKNQIKFRFLAKIFLLNNLLHFSWEGWRRGFVQHSLFLLSQLHPSCSNSKRSKWYWLG